VPEVIAVVCRELAARIAERPIVDREPVGHAQAGRDQPREPARLAAAGGVRVGECVDPHAAVVARPRRSH
jgi:hypothetical protein